MLLTISGIIFPLFSIIAAGYFYGRSHRPNMIAANQITMDVFMPALIFSALAGKTFNLHDYRMLAIGAAVVVIGSGILGWPIARMFGYAPKTLLPPMMFKNAGNMGLPLLVLAFGESALPAAVILLLVENMLHFSIGTLWLGKNVRLGSLWRVPVFAAGIAGIAVSLTDVHIWPPVMTTFKMLGDVSAALMLFSLGVRLTNAPFAYWRIGLVGGVATALTGLIVAYLFGSLFELSTREMDYLLLFGALPPAVLNYIFADQYKQEPEKVASIVITGNLISFIFIALALTMRLA